MCGGMKTFRWRVLLPPWKVYIQASTLQRSPLTFVESFLGFTLTDHMFSWVRKNNLFFGSINQNFHLNPVRRFLPPGFSQPLLLYSKSVAASHTQVGLKQKTLFQSSHRVCVHHISRLLHCCMPSVLTFKAPNGGLRLRSSSKTKPPPGSCSQRSLTPLWSSTCMVLIWTQNKSIRHFIVKLWLHRAEQWRDGSDSKFLFDSQSPGSHTNRRREDCGFLPEAKTSRSLWFFICHSIWFS